MLDSDVVHAAVAIADGLHWREEALLKFAEIKVKVHLNTHSSLNGNESRK